MSRSNPAVLLGFFVALIVAISGIELSKGGFYIGNHEGDTFHLLQIVFRMAEGQWPHLDFGTPIGMLAFAPIVLFIKAGFGVGTSILLAQTLMVTALLPAIFWAAHSRLSGTTAFLFGLITIVFATALMHGTSQPVVSISMHYNRWAWSIAFVVIVLAALPAQVTPRPRLDGFFVGACLAALLLIKVTYFAAFAPVILVALLLRRAFSTVLVAILTGLAAMAIVTVLAGVDIWVAYLLDVLSVVTSESRPQPGLDFGDVVSSPANLGGSLLLLGAIILLRQAREDVAGLVLLLLAPAFFYVTYQNFGNDPQWLMLLGVLLLALQPKLELRNGLGWDLRTAIKVSAMVAFAFGTPSFLNLAFSPFRHLSQDVEKYTALVPGTGVHEDLKTRTERAFRVDARIPFDGEGTELTAHVDEIDRGEPGVVNGEILPRCEIQVGMTAWFEAIAKDLDAAGLSQGKQAFTADVLASHWLFSELEPLESGDPWVYGGLPGFENADYLLVPLCPVIENSRNSVLKLVEERGTTLTEVRRTSLYILFAIGA